MIIALVTALEIKAQEAERDNALTQILLYMRIIEQFGHIRRGLKGAVDFKF